MNAREITDTVKLVWLTDELCIAVKIHKGFPRVGYTYRCIEISLEASNISMHTALSIFFF